MQSSVVLGNRPSVLEIFPCHVRTSFYGWLRILTSSLDTPGPHGLWVELLDWMGKGTYTVASGWSPPGITSVQAPGGEGMYRFFFTAGSFCGFRFTVGIGTWHWGYWVWEILFCGVSCASGSVMMYKWHRVCRLPWCLETSASNPWKSVLCCEPLTNVVWPVHKKGIVIPFQDCEVMTAWVLVWLRIDSVIVGNDRCVVSHLLVWGRKGGRYALPQIREALDFTHGATETPSLPF